MTPGISQPPDDSGGDVAPVAVASPQQERLQREDDVVQHLTIAKFALAIGDVAAADAAVDAALTNSRRSLTDLVDLPESAAHAGKLVRTEPASTVAAPAPRVKHTTT
jgi:hypothetical protein